MHGAVDVRCKPGISLALRLPFYRNSLRNGSYLLNFVPTFLQTEMETANSFLTPYLEREILRIKFKIDSLVPANMPLLLCGTDCNERLIFNREILMVLINTLLTAVLFKQR